ncbi:unnamed protein product [Auanema sp. JU1783]|nr:unnamed protein product [Auanema sp. JU1783]
MECAKTQCWSIFINISGKSTQPDVRYYEDKLLSSNGVSRTSYRALSLCSVLRALVNFAKGVYSHAEHKPLDSLYPNVEARPCL